MTRHRPQAGGTAGAAVNAAASPAFHHRAQARSAKVWPPIWMTSSTDDHEHAIAEEEIAAGQRRRSGIYRAICGSVVTPASLTVPPGRRCQRCPAEVNDPGQKPKRRSSGLLRFGRRLVGST